MSLSSETKFKNRQIKGEYFVDRGLEDPFMSLSTLGDSLSRSLSEKIGAKAIPVAAALVLATGMSLAGPDTTVLAENSAVVLKGFDCSVGLNELGYPNQITFSDNSTMITTPSGVRIIQCSGNDSVNPDRAGVYRGISCGFANSRTENGVVVLSPSGRWSAVCPQNPSATKTQAPQATYIISAYPGFGNSEMLQKLFS